MPPLIAAALVVFLQIVALGAIFPTLEPYTEQFGGSTFIAGLLFALVTAPKVLLNPLWGRLSDRIGRKPVLLILLAGTIAGSLLWALAPVIGGLSAGGLAVLALSRLVVGCFTAQATVALSIASDTSRPDRRAAAMGLLGAAFGTGLLVGMPLGGIVGEIRLAYVGWLCAAFESAALIAALLLLRETHRPTDAPTQPKLRELWAMASQPGVGTLLTITVISWLGASVMIPTLRSLAEFKHEYNIRTASYVFAVWGLAGVVAQGGLIRPMVKHLGEKNTALIGYALFIGGFVWLAAHQSEWQMWAAMAPIGIGGGLAGPPVIAMLTHRASADKQGRVHGLNQSATSLGRAIGMAGGGLLYDTLNPTAPYWFGAAVLAVTLLLLMSLKADHSPVETATPASP